MKKYVIILFICSVGKVYSQGSELKSHKPVYHYAMSQWTTQDGLTSNNINQLFQSKDGYIWISSFNGLLRFDGVEFEPFNIDNLSLLNSNGIYGVMQNRKGEMFFSTQASGAIAYKDNEFRPVYNSTQLAPSIRAMSEDSLGRLWLGTNNNGLYYVEDDSLKIYDHEYVNGITIFSITSGPSGEVYFGTGENGLIILDGIGINKIDNENGLVSNVVKCFKWIGDELYIGTVSGVNILSSQGIRTYEYLAGVEINAIETDNQDQVWFATELGLGRESDNAFEFFYGK